MLQHDERLGRGLIDDPYTGFRRAFGHKEFVVGQLSVTDQRRRFDFPYAEASPALQQNKHKNSERAKHGQYHLRIDSSAEIVRMVNRIPGVIYIFLVFSHRQMHTAYRRYRYIGL